MANEDLASLSLYRLKIEWERLDVEREGLKKSIGDDAKEVERLKGSVRASGAVTGGGGILTFVSFAAAAITPATTVLFLAGLGITYLGGNGCWKDGAAMSEKRQDLHQQRGRLEAVNERMAAIQVARRARRRT